VSPAAISKRLLSLTIPLYLIVTKMYCADHVIDLDDNEYARPPQDDEDDAPNCLG
jgi:hypothetical protein